MWPLHLQESLWLSPLQNHMSLPYHQVTWPTNQILWLFSAQSLTVFQVVLLSLRKALFAIGIP